LGDDIFEGGNDLKMFEEVKKNMISMLIMLNYQKRQLLYSIRYSSKRPNSSDQNNKQLIDWEWWLTTNYSILYIIISVFEYMSSNFLITLLTVFVLVSLAEQPIAASNITRIKISNYLLPNKTLNMEMDIVLPIVKGSYPAVLFLTGLSGLTPEFMQSDFTESVATQGFVIMTVSNESNIVIEIGKGVTVLNYYCSTKGNCLDEWQRAKLH
jgi:hypothetical protein